MTREAVTGLGWLLPVHPEDRERLLEAVVLTGSGLLPRCALTVGMHGHRWHWHLAVRGDAVLVVVEPLPGATATPAGDEQSATSPEPSTLELVRELFAVSMDLASCAGVLDDPWRSRLVAAIRRLDQVGDALRGRGRGSTAGHLRTSAQQSEESPEVQAG